MTAHSIPHGPQPRSWELIDPHGRIHETCQAHTFREAAYILKLSDSQVDNGWAVIQA